jgi:hypothetical protein
MVSNKTKFSTRECFTLSRSVNNYILFDGVIIILKQNVTFIFSILQKLGHCFSQLSKILGIIQLSLGLFLFA